jgi:hypothetical protein
VKQIAAAWPDVLGQIVTGGGPIAAGQDDESAALKAFLDQQAAPPAAKPPNPYRDFPTMRPERQAPKSLPVQAYPTPVMQPALPQVIVGNWAVEIQGPMGSMVLMLSLAVQPNGQLVFQGAFPGTPQSVSGLWGVSNNQVTLIGWKFMGGAWGPRVPYETTVTFASWSHAQLQGISSGNEQVIWRRQS